MSIALTKVFGEVYQNMSGIPITEATFVASGLTAAASNTVPHGLPRAPRRVWFTAAGNAAAATQANLDTSQGSTDATGKLPGGKEGFDGTNIYIYAPSGVTAIEVHVQY